MKKIKKAFTLIEIIWIILIIGILAQVMIPRLVATRDDARISVALSDVGRLVSELTIYYTAKGYFKSNLSEMTSVTDANYSVGWDSVAQKGVITYYTPKNENGVEPCMTISLQNRDGNMTISNVAGVHENVCRGLHSVDKYKSLLTTKLLIGNNIF